jgi:hypothetical protein
LDLLPYSFSVSVSDRAREVAITPESVFFPEASSGSFGYSHWTSPYPSCLNCNDRAAV